MLRRRLMINNEKQHDIIKDGLVFRLNGKNRGGVSEHWIDEIAGDDFILYNCIETNDSVKFDGQNSYGRCANHIGVLDSLGSIEFVIRNADFSDKSSINQVIYMPMSSNNKNFLAASIVSKKRYLCTMSSSTMYVSNINGNIKNVTVYGEPNKYYENKQKLLTPLRDSYWGKVPASTIGCYGNSLTNKFFGEICEVRLYNRHLEEKEILNNQQYDIDTYFNGIVE